MSTPAYTPRHRLPQLPLDRREATRLAAQVLGQYMADWTPEERADALSDLESVTVFIGPEEGHSEDR